MGDNRTREFAVPALIPGTPECRECIRRLSDEIGTLYGVAHVVVDPQAATLSVTFDPQLIDEDHLEAAAGRAGVAISKDVEHSTYRVTGLDCPDCAATLDKSVSRVEGVLSATLSFATGTLLVEWSAGSDPGPRVEAAVKAMGYGIARPEDEPRAGVDRGDRRLEVSTAVSGVLLALAWLLEGGPWSLSDAVIAIAYGMAAAVGGAATLRRAVGAVRARAVDMNVLMSAAVVGAFAIGEWSEGAMVVFLYSVGMVLESRSLARTRRAMRELISLTPPSASVRRDGREEVVDLDEVRVGEHVVVRPGERVPFDGRVVSGLSAVDESPVSGESMPRDKGPGDVVFAGSLNGDGILAVEVEKAAADSTLARIIYLVEEAHVRRAPSQRLVDRFARVYTPVVVALAVAVALVPPLVAWMLGYDWGSAGEWFYRGLVVLVVSCPCALVISTPVAIVSAISQASRMGVLVKGGVFLERAAKVRVVAFDKTGTLTVGRPTVAEVVAIRGGLDESDVVQIAAALEAGSTHPLARAVVEAAGAAGDAVHLESFRDEAGRGVRGVVNGIEYMVGSADAAVAFGVPFHEFADALEHLESGGMTTLVVGREGVALGVIGVADQVRAQSARTIEDLEDAGISHVVMLTGDNDRTAQAVGELAGVRDVRARLLPEEKAAFVEELRDRHGAVAMVGDGINDAPALAVADIGIAMGAAGSDTALETADVALMGDDLSALPHFFRLGRRTVANIVQNVVVSVSVKVIVLLLAAFGVATLWMAVFADTGVALLVILNGLRLTRAGRGT